VLDYGRLVMIKQLLDNAAREGARQAVTNTGTMTTSQIQTIVTNYMAGQTLSGMNIQVYQCDPTTGNNIGSWNNTTLGGMIAVQVTGNFKPLLSTFSRIPNPLAMTTTAMMTCEAN
jgi:Flp pilus assembly protein TadG